MLRWLISKLFRIRMIDKQHLKIAGPTIIMPNHVSFLDALIMALVLPKNVCFMVNKGIAQKLKWAMKLRKTVAIDPLNPYAIRDMIKLVKSGVPLVVFPEGRITVTGGLMKMYPGAAFIAVKSEATIIPVWIEGLQYSRFSRMQGKFPLRRFPQVSIRFGEGFQIQPEADESMRAVKQRASAILYRKLQTLGYQQRRQQGVNLFDQFLLAAEKYGPDTKIVEDINGQASYKQLIKGATALSIVFAKKFSEENVGVLLPNVNPHIATLFALFRIGKSPAILNFSMGVQNVLDNCSTASVSNIITSRAFLEKGGLLDWVEQIEAAGIGVHFLENIRQEVNLSVKLKTLSQLGHKANTAGKNIILFTSGSEGKPKGVVLGHDQIFANIQQANMMIDCSSQDKVLNALPMFHSFGLTAGTLFPLLFGIPSFTYPSPLHYRVIPELIYDRNCTILFGTSTFLAGYGRYAHPFDMRSIRYVFAGAEKLQSAVKDLWSNKFGVRIFEGYGTTEAAPIVSLNTPLFCKAGSVGIAVPGMETKLETVEGISEGGRLWIRGDNVMKGYLIHGKGFVPLTEWYDTGDVVTIDSEGYITIQARLKRFAKIGGEMVSLELAESIVKRMLQTESGMAAVVSVSDERKGEKLVAYATEAIDLNALRKSVAEDGLSPLVAPALVEQVRTIPLLGSGKTDYISLAKMAKEKYGSASE
jgi:acyl-[acyl-carrier-protein]-phospholipid O-acyltransferase/long-chain-fatty-acid--[acyl-carrier-protein] ligase